MINLLPPKVKYDFFKEEILRDIFTLSIVVLLSLVCFGLILFVIKINLETKLLMERNILIQKKEELESCQEKGIRNEITFSNQALKIIDSFYHDRLYLVDLFDKIFQILPREIVLANFSYQKESGEISLSGLCPDRATLLIVKDRLEEEEIFYDIYFPVSNWIKPTEINFLISFKIK